jgi:hypothetical protein
MAAEAIAHFVLEAVAYPVFYVVGFIVVKSLSLGRARILALTDRGYEKEMRWYQFFVRRSGVRFWTPESIILVGGLFALCAGVGVYLVLSQS